MEGDCRAQCVGTDGREREEDKIVPVERRDSRWCVQRR